jgi:nitrogen fixation/metabolism regulation signal transduction histidine kinase
MEGENANFGCWVLGSMSSGVVAIDTDHRIVILNDGARRILGSLSGDAGTVLGEPCAKVLGGQPGVARLLVEAPSDSLCLRSTTPMGAASARR